MSVPFYLSFAALWILVVFHSLVLVSLVRTVSQLQRKDDGGPPQLNQEAPKFCGVALSGAAISSADFAGRLTALLFVSARCPSCMITIEEMKALRSRVDGSVIVICEDDRSKCARLAAVHKLDLSMVVDYDQRIGRLFNIPGPPTAVLIDEHNRIRSFGHPIQGEELDELLDGARRVAVAEAG